MGQISDCKTYPLSSKDLEETDEETLVALYDLMTKVAANGRKNGNLAIFRSDDLVPSHSIAYTIEKYED